MTPEALRAVLERHHLVHDYLCSCDAPDTEFSGWDAAGEWVEHVVAAEFPAAQDAERRRWCYHR